jgi:lipoprotein-anchoring transpeptidase ErfK/SrfK
MVFGYWVWSQFNQLPEETRSQYTPVSYSLTLAQWGIDSTWSYVVLWIHFLKWEVLQLDRPVLFETSAQESALGEQSLVPSIQNSPQQEGTNSTTDMSSDGVSGSVVPFYKEVRSIVWASESIQREMLLQKIRALEHEITFLASFYRVNHDGDMVFDDVTIMQSYHDIFSEENLVNVSYQNLKDSYDSSFLALQEYRDESERLRNIARIKRQDLILSEKQKWVDTTPPSAPFFDIYSQIFISLLDQKMYVYEDGDLILSTPITSGRKRFETVTWVFQVYNKQKNKILRSPFPDEKYELWVDYWIAFYGAYGIHDSCNRKNCWRKEFWVSSYTSAGSHGCVNTPYEAVKWIYDWAKIGTTVYVD